MDRAIEKIGLSRAADNDQPAYIHVFGITNRAKWRWVHKPCKKNFTKDQMPG